MRLRPGRTWLLLTILFPLLGSMALAGQDEPKTATNRLLGQRMADFTLKDATTGKNVSLYGYHGNIAVVLVFLGTDCPVGNLYASRLVELNNQYRDRKIAFVGIHSNAHETVEQIAAHAREHSLNFPVLKDDGNVVADMALAERTPEVVVLDGLATVRYRGAIDDQYGVGTRKPAPVHHYLKAALDEILTGGRVDVKATDAVGCLLDRVEPTPSKLGAGNNSRVRSAAPVIVEARRAEDVGAKVGKVNYASDVAVIVQNRCQNCHRPGEVGPFPLLTYDDLRAHSAMLREVVEERRMPPWHADPRIGHFSNDRSLSARERATLLAWVDQGTPLGDPKAVPAAKTFPEGWTIGTPDLVFETPEPFVVPAQGTVSYVHVRVPSGLKEDVWVQAAEARPGDRSVVHHIIVYTLERGALVRGGGFDSRSNAHLCGYAPGDMPSVYPPGSAKKITAGSEFLFQIHYTPTGKVRTDRSKVGLVLAKAPVQHQAHTHGIANPRFEIPPGADNYQVKSQFQFPKDAHLLSLMPHMHLRGKSFSYKAVYPDGRSEDLLSVPAFDFGWQSYYTLAEPKAMPKGTKILCEAHFDNSTANPYNPDPSKAIRWGEQTWDEMMIGYVDFIDDAPAGVKTAQGVAAAPPDLARALRLLNNAAARKAR